MQSSNPETQRGTVGVLLLVSPHSLSTDIAYPSCTQYVCLRPINITRSLALNVKALTNLLLFI